MLENGDRLTSAQNVVQHMLQFSGADGFVLHRDIGNSVKHTVIHNCTRRGRSRSIINQYQLNSFVNISII